MLWPVNGTVLDPACADEFGQDGCFGLIFGDVCEVIEDQQMVSIQTFDGRFERQVLAGELQDHRESALTRNVTLARVNRQDDYPTC